jgi:hypothetical protein
VLCEAAGAYDGRMRYRRQIDVAAARNFAFAYLSDFANGAEWDPAIVEARRLTPAPTAVGSRFEVVALFRGRRQGVYRLAEPFLRSTFARMGDEALDGLAARLAQASG